MQRLSPFLVYTVLKSTGLYQSTPNIITIIIDLLAQKQGRNLEKCEVIIKFIFTPAVGIRFGIYIISIKIYDNQIQEAVYDKEEKKRKGLCPEWL